LKKIIILFISITLLISGCARHKSPDMIFIDGGTFVMGSPFDEPERDFDEMQREITLDSFYIGVYEVSQKEYRQIKRKNPSHFKGDNLPVDTINWYNALDFCNRLSVKEGLNPVYRFSGENVLWDRTANGYRLPTEAEWEYASRAGTASPFSTGENITVNQANFNGNYPYNDGEMGSFRGTTIDVGSFLPNQWGVYDMNGNVFEWCWDWHDYYNREQNINPRGAETGTNRVIRGGSWANGGYVLRSAYRGIYIPGGGNERIGFRLARNAD